MAPKPATEVCLTEDFWRRVSKFFPLLRIPQSRCRACPFAGPSPPLLRHLPAHHRSFLKVFGSVAPIFMVFPSALEPVCQAMSSADVELQILLGVVGLKRASRPSSSISAAKA